MNYISILSTLITFIFAFSVFSRYRYKKGRHLLFWGIGLIFFGLGTLMEALLAFSFHPWELKIWYLTGAMLTAAWLGQGTVYLLVRKRNIANILAGILIALSILAFILIMVAPMTEAAGGYNPARPASEQYKDILVRSGLVTLLTVLLNIYGTIALVGGAIYSAYLFWRKRVLLNRVIGNILIAAGALMPAMAGSFVKAGMVDWLYISEFLGVILMYIGFLQATVTKPASQPVVSPSQG